MAQKVLIISDNENIVSAFAATINRQDLSPEWTFSFACHFNNTTMIGMNIDGNTIFPINMKAGYQDVIDNYDLVISAHCKQIFPAPLVESRRCINIHPGYNPFNRGWYPQVFSILNGKTLGATIHEMDAQLDHGKIIAREKVEVYASDTSYSAYMRVQELECRLIQEHLMSILTCDYEAFEPEEEGNINSKQDFSNLQEIDLTEMVTFQQAIDRLRALTHPPYKNAYFIDPKTGEKILMSVQLEQQGEE